MSDHKKRRLSLAVVCCFLAFALGGCKSSVDALNKDISVTLPPTSVSYKAPTGDTDQELTQSILLFVPNTAGTRLIALPEQMTLPAARHPAEAVLRQLFAFTGNEEGRPLSPDTVLQLSPVSPVEISGETATVNLGASALSVSHAEFYIICQAIANTLTQWDDIRYVNVLVSSMQPGLDVGASIPGGCFVQNLNESCHFTLTCPEITQQVPLQLMAQQEDTRNILLPALQFADNPNFIPLHELVTEETNERLRRMYEKTSSFVSNTLNVDMQLIYRMMQLMPMNSEEWGL